MPNNEDPPGNDRPNLDETQSFQPESSPREIAAHHQQRVGVRLPERIGPYKVLEALGEGGMGTVYLAEQTSPVHRRVAIKIVKLGMDTKHTLARFEAEREALALMNHPGVAKIFDAGASDEGRPYFVMEYVPGISVNDYCDRHRLSTDERLQLFIKVCNAVQHAHQKGIIHRDIKPSNVLVAVLDGEAVPKVIDFGVAKATQQRLTERTLFTEQGQFIGTPGYMSPEQAEMSALDVDTRTDIYSLGVLLYELLVGARPFDEEAFRQAGFAEIQRIIREVDPPRPSTRLSGLGESSTQVVQKRRTELRTLSRILHADLDWVVMKCLEKDRNRRYDTPNALAMEIQRFLGNEPVLAGPPSAAYRLRKFVRRNKIQVAAGLTVAAVLAAGLAGTSYGLVQAVRAREGEADQRRIAEQREGEALAAREEAERLGGEARRNLSTYYVGHGVRLMDNGDLMGALVWFTEALQQDKEDPARENLQRIRIASVLRQFPRPRRMRFHNYDKDGRFAETSEDGRRILTIGFDRARVWEAETGVPITPPLKQDQFVTHASFSPDGRLVVTSSADKTARLWDAETGEPITPPLIHDDIVQHASFSPSGRRVVTASWDDTARLWDTQTGEPIAPPLKHGNNVQYASFSSDGRRVVTVSWDNNTRVWDAATGDPVTPPLSHSGEVRHASFSPDGRRVLTASADKTARVWNAETGEPITTPLRHDDKVHHAVFSPDGRWVVTASADKTARVWDAATGAPITPPLKHGGSVRRASFSPNGQRVMTVSTDQNVRVWQVGSPSTVGLLLKHNSQVSHASFSSDGLGILTVSTDGDRVWDATTGGLVTLPLEHDRPVREASFSFDGARIVTASFDGTARVWNTETGMPVTPPLRHGDSVYGASFSSDGRRVVTASADKTARVWNAETGKPITPPLKHDDEVSHASFSPDGRWVVTASADKTARVWDATTGAPITPPLKHEGRVRRASFCPNGQRVMTESTGQNVRVWEVASRSPVALLLKHSSRVSHASFSSDGLGILTVSTDGDRVWDATTGVLVTPPAEHRTFLLVESLGHDWRRVVARSIDVTTRRPRAVRVWDRKAGKPITPPLKHHGELLHASFSPDGRWVVTVSFDGTARVWDSESGLPITPLLRHGDGLVRRVAFSPDGRRVATSGSDNTTRVWDISPDERNVDYLVLLAQLLSSQRLDSTGTLGSIDTETVHVIWDTLRSKYPSEFVASP